MNWSSQYHNLLWVFLLLCAASFGLLPASSDEAHAEFAKEEAAEELREASLKHGRYESMDRNGKLKSVVNYHYGKKHGISYLYYSNGKVHLEMPYNTNLREGTSKKYYKSGELYATTPYVNNKIEGIRTTYFESGRVRATVPYHNSWPGTGLKEYLSDGTERRQRIGIHIEKTGNIWKFKAEEPCRKQKYYLGNLIDGQYLDESRLVLLTSNEDGAILDLNKIGGQDRKATLEVICRCTTLQNNPLILSTRF